MRNTLKLHGQTPAQALDLLAAHVACDAEEHEETVHDLLEADADIAAGRTKAAREVYALLRLKHGLPEGRN